MNIHSIYRVVLPFFRRRRMRRFLAAVPLTHQTQMLDVGGYPSFWQNWALPAKITILNLAFAPGLPEQFAGKYKLVVGDGTQLNFKDKEFDLVFSNSVIEHLGSYPLQEKFACEARRVGGGVWIQTPARAFFFEPHLLTPFIHWFPRVVRRRLLRYGTVWGWMTRPSKKQIEDFLNEV